MIKRSPFGSIAQFQLQGQEQIHQVQTNILFRASNWQGNKRLSILERGVSLQYLQLNPGIWQWRSKELQRRKTPIHLETVFRPKSQLHIH